jgi:CHAT domain-containing protein
MGPIHAALQRFEIAEGGHIVLIPPASLGMFPLHAAWREKDGRKRAFFDDYSVSYVPSALTLQICQQRVQEPDRGQKSLMALINPTGDLPHTEVEGREAASFFPSGEALVLEGREAVAQRVLEETSTYGYLHFACHGKQKWKVPLNSYLVLRSETHDEPAPLFLGLIMNNLDLSCSRLVVLSACETGIPDLMQRHEYLGLPAGFLQTGAPAVVSSLWAVNDLSTALLMGEFYRRHMEEGEWIAEALRGAQLWLRDATAGEMRLAEQYEQLYQDSGRRDAAALRGMRYFRANPGVKPFAHPYHWSGFTFTGV